MSFGIVNVVGVGVGVSAGAVGVATAAGVGVTTTGVAVATVVTVTGGGVAAGAAGELPHAANARDATKPAMAIPPRWDVFMAPTLPR